MHCINTNNKDYKSLKEQTNINEKLLKAKIIIWQEQNGLDKWPTLE